MLVRFIEFILIVLSLYGIFTIFSFSVTSLINSLFFASLAGSLFALFQIATNTLGDNQQRFGDLFWGGGFGILPSILCLISLFKFLNPIKRKRYQKKIYLLLYCLGISVLFMNATRTWMVLCIIFSIVFLYLNRNKKTYNLVQGIYIPSLVGLIIVLLQVFIVSDYFNVEKLILPTERFVSLLRNIVTADIDSSLNSRFYKWDRALQVAFENPLWGVGFEQMNLGLRHWIDPLSNRRADNQYLDLFAMTGIGGVFAFMLFGACIIKKLKSSFDINLPIFSLLFSIASLWFVGGFFWAILYGYPAIFFAYFLSTCLHSIKAKNGCLTD